jgi:gamma-carbonic anhydrase
MTFNPKDQILPYQDILPLYKSPLYLLPAAYVIGQVTMGEHVSLWPNTTVRGDMNTISIGSYTNIQDNSVIHVTHDTGPTAIGNYVTVGHQCIIHGCTIRDYVLVGMGSIIMDHADLGEYVILGAGSLVTEKTKIPSGTLAYGRPAKPIRDLTDAERAIFESHAKRYVATAQNYPECCIK